VALTDPDPYNASATLGYSLGDYDGWARDVVVTDGYITIRAGTGALDPTLCFVEIGPKDSHVDQATTDRLNKTVTDATNRSGGPAFQKNWNEVRTFAYGGDYIDAPIMMQAKNGAVAKNYFIHANSLYSVQAVTDAAGAVVEQYTYSAYGERKIVGSTSKESAIGLTVGFTGLRNEGDLVFARGRYLSPYLGRWIGRDPAGYVNGYGLYVGYFAPNSLDPSGLKSISFKFSAFIPKANGVEVLKNPLPNNRWGIEPPAPSQVVDQFLGYPLMFSTDNRDKAGMPGTSRLRITGSISSEFIGKLVENHVENFAMSTDDPSHRIQVGTVLGLGGSSSYEAFHGSLVAKTAKPSHTESVSDIQKSKTDCDDGYSILTINSSAAYPFLDVAPNIDITPLEVHIRRTSGKIDVKLKGRHNQFPAYEGLINNRLVYESYPPISAGPGIWNLGFGFYDFDTPWIQQ
jgi:hypothetical protein